MREANILTVQFIGPQDCEDLYRCQEDGRVYVRQPCDDDHVRWLSATKWRGGYEADGPLDAGTKIRVVNRENLLLFEEKVACVDGYSDTVAPRIGQFQDEALEAQAEQVAKTLDLTSYTDWKTWLMKSARDHKYTGYSENWCYHEVEYGDFWVMFPFEYLGRKAYCTGQTITHKISGQKWTCVEIRDKSKAETLMICGYKLEEKK